MLSNAHKNDMNDSCCKANEAGRKVREVIDHSLHDARDAMASAEHQIRTHPVKSSAIAAGIGFLLGALLRRR